MVAQQPLVLTKLHLLTPPVVEDSLCGVGLTKAKAAMVSYWGLVSTTHGARDDIANEIERLEEVGLTLQYEPEGPGDSRRLLNPFIIFRLANSLWDSQAEEPLKNQTKAVDDATELRFVHDLVNS